jgi:hypothetical protein
MRHEQKARAHNKNVKDTHQRKTTKELNNLGQRRTKVITKARK